MYRHTSPSVVLTEKSYSTMDCDHASNNIGGGCPCLTLFRKDFFVRKKARTRSPVTSVIRATASTSHLTRPIRLVSVNCTKYSDPIVNLWVKMLRAKLCAASSTRTWKRNGRKNTRRKRKKGLLRKKWPFAFLLAVFLLVTVTQNWKKRCSVHR